ncbi:hypothetical protein P9112_014730 [Eukaryota sp. TZLM1-RC]
MSISLSTMKLFRVLSLLISCVIPPEPDPDAEEEEDLEAPKVYESVTEREVLKERLDRFFRVV